MICGGPGVSDAYYCKECTVQEKDVSAFFFLIQTALFIRAVLYQHLVVPGPSCSKVG